MAVTDPKVTNATSEVEARDTEAVLAFMIEECKRLGHVQRDEDGGRVSPAAVCDEAARGESEDGP